MLAIGLTGSIATGKSTVLGFFSDLGVPVFSSDEAVHRLYRDEGAQAVEALFPGTVIDGVVDRVALSRRILAEPTRLVELEATIHPLVRAEIDRFVKDAAASGADMAIVDIPLLFEGGADWGFDAVVVTACDETIQRARALSRPGMSVEKLDAILARQMPQADKMARADYVIDTSESLEATRASVKAFVAAARKGSLPSGQKG